jgi:flagellar motor switch protein FliG
MEELDRVDQAAILMLTLGEQDAAAVLRHLEPREVQRVGAAMAELSELSTGQIQGAMDQFLETVTDETGLAIGTRKYLQNLLTTAMGQDRAQVVLERILGGHTDGLDRLRWMDSRAIADFVLAEHPQIQAIVLSYLDSDQAAEVLNYFTDQDQRREVLMRVAQLDTISPLALAELSQVLEDQVKSASNRRFAELGGRKTAADILNNFSPADNEVMLGAIKEADESLSEQIQELMFVFDNLMAVDDRGIQTILREVSSDALVLALKGAEGALQEKIFGNMSKRAAELLKDDMEAKGPVRVSDVEAAQKDILSTARKLAEDGEIALGGGGDMV